MYEIFDQFLLTEFRNIPIHTIFRFEGHWWKKSGTFGYSNTTNVMGITNTGFIIAVHKNEMPNLYKKLSKQVEIEKYRI